MQEKAKIVIHLYRGKVAGIYADQNVSFVVFDESMKEEGVEEDHLRTSLKNLGVRLDDNATLKFGLAYAVDDALIESGFDYKAN